MEAVRLPQLTQRLTDAAAAVAPAGSDAWELHRRAAERKAGGEDVLMLTLGAPDTPAPAEAVEAAINALRSDQPAMW
jgi:arginine:pyruvate transaminase